MNCTPHIKNEFSLFVWSCALLVAWVHIVRPFSLFSLGTMWFFLHCVTAPDSAKRHDCDNIIFM
jgi:hypothetical protein